MDGSLKKDSAASTSTEHVPVLSHPESSSEPCRLTRQTTPPPIRVRVDTFIDYGRIGAQLSTPALVARNQDDFQSRRNCEAQEPEATNDSQTPRVLRVTNGISAPISAGTTDCEKNQRQSPAKKRSHPHPGDVVSVVQHKANRNAFEIARPRFSRFPGGGVSIEQKKFGQSAFKLHVQKRPEGWEARKRDLKMFNEAISEFRNEIPSESCYRRFHSRAENWGQTHDRFLQLARDLVTMDGFDWAIFLMTNLEAEAGKLQVVMDDIGRNFPLGSGWRGRDYDTGSDNTSASFFSDNTGPSIDCGVFSRLRCWIDYLMVCQPRSLC